MKFKRLTGRKDFGIEPEFFRPVLFLSACCCSNRHSYLWRSLIRHNFDIGNLGQSELSFDNSILAYFVEAHLMAL